MGGAVLHAIATLVRPLLLRLLRLVLSRGGSKSKAFLRVSRGHLQKALLKDAMGNCCCVDSAVVASDMQAVNKTPPHHDFAECAKRDVVEGDPTSVARDFPRVVCIVGENAEREKFHPADFGARNKVVKNTVAAIADLVGEADVREQFIAEWSNHVRRDTVDLSHPILDVFLSAGMLAKLPSPKDSDSGKKKYVSNCNTFALLRYFNQGVMFFPSQRVRHLMWFPWIEHMQDANWVARIFKNPAIDANQIFVRHVQTTTNYVDAKNAADVPKFEVDWVFEFVVDARTAAPIDCTLEITAVRVLANTSVCKSQLWAMRCERLGDRVFNQFGIELKTVSKLAVSGIR